MQNWQYVILSCWRIGGYFSSAYYFNKPVILRMNFNVLCRNNMYMLHCRVKVRSSPGSWLVRTSYIGYVASRLSTIQTIVCLPGSGPITAWVWSVFTVWQARVRCPSRRTGTETGTMMPVPIGPYRMGVIPWSPFLTDTYRNRTDSYWAGHTQLPQIRLSDIIMCVYYTKSSRTS